VCYVSSFFLPELTDTIRFLGYNIKDKKRFLKAIRIGFCGEYGFSEKDCFVG